MDAEPGRARDRGAPQEDLTTSPTFSRHQDVRGPDEKAKRPSFGRHSDYYEHVARGYDLVADAYDDVEGRNSISERVRRTSLRTAMAVFPPGGTILELGCGTGRDAVAFARHGIRVVATDLSPTMVELTRRRAKREGVSDFVTANLQSAAEAANSDGPFDGAYSNGAVLNLEPDLDGVAQGLGRSLRSGAQAVLTAANRLSLFELALYPVILRPRKAFRKLGSSVPIPISREGIGRRYVVPTRFLTPNEFLRPFRTEFDLVHRQGLQVLTPPWNLVDMASILRGAVAPLEAMEDRVGHRWGLRSLGAIYLVVLRRKGA